MTYTPKVGDIVNVRAEVLHPLTPGGRTELRVIDGRPLYGTEGGITVPVEKLTLVERPKRELKPGDRLVHSGSNREYLVLDNNTVWDRYYSKALSREEITFDELATRHLAWQYFPRNETPEDA